MALPVLSKVTSHARSKFENNDVGPAYVDYTYVRTYVWYAYLVWYITYAYVERCGTL